MCIVKSPKIPSITTEFLNRMMTTDDYVYDDDQSIIRSSYCLSEILSYQMEYLELLNEGQ
jgi:hypothetical protein